MRECCVLNQPADTIGTCRLLKQVRVLTERCSCFQGQITISKGEQCTLLDNSEKTRWTVRSAAGQQGVVPAACFVLPPPDAENVEFAKRSVQSRDTTSS